MNPQALTPASISGPPALRLALGLLFGGLLAAGCAHSRDAGGRTGAAGGYLPSDPPVFLSGPLSVLLTNPGGFSAHLIMRSGPLAGHAELVSGQLLGRGGQLLFEPDGRQPADKNYRAAGISFVWDVAQNRGFERCEALQGWAPISSAVRVTNTVPTPASAPPEKINGHPCQETLVAVASSDASTALFRVWRAADLNGFPLRITTATNAPPRTLDFSKVQFEPPGNELFSPPEGFTKYQSADVMMGELALRRQSLKRRVTSGWNENEPGAGPENRPPR